MPIIATHVLQRTQTFWVWIGRIYSFSCTLDCHVPMASEGYKDHSCGQWTHPGFLHRLAKLLPPTLESESVRKRAAFCLLISLRHLGKYNFYSFTFDLSLHTKTWAQVLVPEYMTNTCSANNCPSISLPVFLETNMPLDPLPWGFFLKLWQDFRILKLGWSLRPAFVTVRG